MWVCTHVFAGLAIAALVGGPWWLLLALVVGAHVVMDLIPHWDYTVSPRFRIYVWCDLTASVAAWLAAWLLLGMPFWLALMGPLSGGPDLDVLVGMIRRRPERHWFPSHWQRFPHGKAERPFGIGVQAVFVAASIATVLAVQPF